MLLEMVSKYCLTHGLLGKGFYEQVSFSCIVYRLSLEERCWRQRRNEEMKKSSWKSQTSVPRKKSSHFISTSPPRAGGRVKLSKQERREMVFFDEGKIVLFHKLQPIHHGKGFRYLQKLRSLLGLCRSLTDWLILLKFSTLVWPWLTNCCRIIGAWEDCH